MSDEGNIYSAYAPRLLHRCFLALCSLLLLILRGR
jgi:hypothetical protein